MPFVHDGLDPGHVSRKIHGNAALDNHKDTRPAKKPYGKTKTSRSESASD